LITFIILAYKNNIFMKQFTANRLSGGNRIFPAEISIDNFGINLKIPGLFSGKEKSLSFDKISSVKIDSPLIGFSKITFDTMGWDRIVAEGFEKSDALEIKQLVESGIQSVRYGNSSSGNTTIHVSPEAEAIRVQAELEKEKMDLQQQKEAEESWDRAFDGMKKLFSGGKSKAAAELHHKLAEIETDISIALSQGNKEEAGKLIRQLRHDSNLFVAKTNTTYTKYWTDKREAFLKKL
jgi:hypothetical protein